ncbi:MAG: hypothetical protein GPJ11_14845 [Microcystis aeruginosa L211-101]|nr:hypothetical protein [Microcystis aeruginosa L211-11]NCR32133.1 hypothetical protein [Microcystis aeruginosa L211-101]
MFKRLTEQNITLSVTDKFKERLSDCYSCLTFAGLIS